MLAKLFKHEWKAVSILLLLIHGALLVFSFPGRIIISMASSNTGDYVDIIFAFYILFYVLGIVLVAFMTYLYLARRFMSNLFSDEGYLMHTLPVTPAQHLWSKFFVFVIWMIIDLIVIGLSLIILFLNKETLSELQSFMVNLWDAFITSFNSSPVGNVFYWMLSCIVSVFYSIFSIYFSICIGSLCKTHKVLGSLGTFIGIGIVTSIISSILMMIFQYTTTVTSGLSTAVTTQVMGDAYYLVTLVFNLLLALGFYFGSHYILSKKLNLQ